MRFSAIVLTLFLPLVLPAQWKKTALPLSKDLYDIHVNGARAYLAGHNSALLRSDDTGRSWTVLTPTIPSNLRAVWFLSADTGFITGENARIQKTTDGGNNWTQKYVRTAAYAYDIRFSGLNGIAVGKDMLAVSSRDGGETWSVDTTLQLGKKLNSVCITPGGMCWAAGDSGFMLRKHIASRKWENLKFPTTVDLNSITCSGDSVIIACGGMPDSAQVGKFYNILLRSTDSGKTWAQTTVPEMKIINAAWFSDPDSGILAGSNGIISRSYHPIDKRGQQLSGTANTLNAVFFSGRKGFIAGDGGILLTTTNMGGFGLGIKETEAADLHVYPQPSTGRLQIRCTTSVSQIALTDTGGKEIPFTAGEDLTWVETTARGAMILTLYLSDGRVIHRLIAVQG